MATKPRKRKEHYIKRCTYAKVYERKEGSGFYEDVPSGQYKVSLGGSIVGRWDGMKPFPSRDTAQAYCDGYNAGLNDERFRIGAAAGLCDINGFVNETTSW